METKAQWSFQVGRSRLPGAESRRGPPGCRGAGASGSMLGVGWGKQEGGLWGPGPGPCWPSAETPGSRSWARQRPLEQTRSWQPRGEATGRTLPGRSTHLLPAQVAQVCPDPTALRTSPCPDSSPAPRAGGVNPSGPSPGPLAARDPQHGTLQLSSLQAPHQPPKGQEAGTCSPSTQRAAGPRPRPKAQPCRPVPLPGVPRAAPPSAPRAHRPHGGTTGASLTSAAQGVPFSGATHSSAHSLTQSPPRGPPRLPFIPTPSHSFRTPTPTLARQWCWVLASELGEAGSRGQGLVTLPGMLLWPHCPDLGVPSAGPGFMQPAGSD
nr:translation initiation factor IF-2 [Oryctolagus cuniculus]